MEQKNKRSKILEKKKKLLSKYYWLTKQKEDLELKLERITIKLNSIKSSTISDSPKGTVGQDIIDLIAQQEKYKDLIVRKIIKIENAKMKIESSIDTLEDSRLQLIIQHIYLENNTYKEVADILKVSERHVRRLHDIAIRLIKIVEI